MMLTILKVFKREGISGQGHVITPEFVGTANGSEQV
jgi:hypothetical protein